MRIVAGLFIFLLVSFSSHAQVTERINILFVLDASNSMSQDWGGETKWQTATNTLLNLLDSLQKITDEDVYFGLRAYGHQSLTNQNNCQDSENILPIGKHTTEKVYQKLRGVKPMGITPLSYSLIQAAADFDGLAGHHAIILLTDGYESCPEDPCTVLQVLEEKGIALRPMIIGMNLEDRLFAKYDCFGTVWNTHDISAFQQKFKSALTYGIYQKTVSINLEDHLNRTVDTALAYSIYESESGKHLGSWVYGLHVSGRPDSIHILPVNNVDVVLHSNPPIERYNVDVSSAMHTDINLPFQQGSLILENLQVPIFVQSAKGVVYHGIAKEHIALLKGSYQVDLGIYPPQHFAIEISSGEESRLPMPRPGRLELQGCKNLLMALFKKEDKSWKTISVFDGKKDAHALVLMPGTYHLVYRALSADKTWLSKRLAFTVKPGETKQINL